MRAEFKRKVILTTSDAYAVIAVNEEREDILEYLNGDRENNAVNKYLSTIGLLNTRNELTMKGRELIESGFMLHEEEGKYRIWYIKDDKLTGEKVLYLKREKYERESRLDSTIDLSGNHTVIYVTDNKYKKETNHSQEEIHLKKVESNCKNVETTPIQLNWNWEMNKNHIFPIQASYFYEGSVHGIIDKLNQYKFAIEFSIEDFKKMLDTNQYTWNAALSKIQIPFEVNQYSPEEWKNFRVKKFDLVEKDFGKGRFDVAFLSDVNVMPIDTENAKNWKDYLVNLELKKDYIIEEKFNELIFDMNRKDSFSSFSLPAESTNGYIRSIKPNRNQKTEEYFHLSAPFDLNPFSFETKPIRAFTIVSGDTKSYQDICSQLLSPGKSIEKIIYSDRYIRTDNQRKSFLSLLDAFKNKNSQRITLFTQTNEFLSEEKAGIQIIITDKNWDTHERILAIVYSDGTKDLWNISRGIDFIKFNSGTLITKETKGKTQNCTFAKLEENSVESYIKEKF